MRRSTLIFSLFIRPFSSLHQVKRIITIAGGGLLAIGITDGCTTLQPSEELESTPLRMVAPSACDVAARLVEAGYLQRPFDKLLKQDIAAALGELASEAGEPPPASDVLEADDPLWVNRLSKVSVSHDTLEACQSVRAMNVGVGVGHALEAGPRQEAPRALWTPLPPAPPPPGSSPATSSPLPDLDSRGPPKERPKTPPPRRLEPRPIRPHGEAR